MQKFHEEFKNVKEYVRYGNTKGRRSVAAVVVNRDRGIWSFGEAITHPNDSFSKAVGRDMAIGRAKKEMAKGNFIRVTDQVEFPFEDDFIKWVNWIFRYEKKVCENS